MKTINSINKKNCTIMQNKYSKLVGLTAVLLAAPTLLFAADAHAAVPAAAASDTGNMTLAILASLSIVLLFVIGVLANVTKNLADISKEKIGKMRNDGLIKTIALLLLFSIPALHSFAEAAAPAAPAAAHDILNGVSDNDFYMIITILVLEFAVIFMMLFNIKKLNRVISAQYEETLQKATAGVVDEKSWFWDNFNNAVAIEKEKDVLLDHNYDGIQELDNSLPPWWKYGFYITIVIAVIYLFRYQVAHTGMNPEEEYAEEMQKGDEEKAAYLAKAGNSVDENTVTLMTDPTALAEGKTLFLANCSACHLQDGGGLVGPNLTDDYWLHGGSIKDVFKTIKYGYMDKGMKSWKDDFPPKQLQELASYVKSLHGTKPATPKAPQGDLYVEAGTKAPAAAAAPKADSAAKK